MYTYPNVPRCHYIKTNGTRCGSPALRDQKFCYFHQRWQQQRINLRHYPGEESYLELPVLEDADSIQMALTQVMRLVLSQKINPKEAGLLLYALQIASANLKRTEFQPRDEKNVVIDPALLAQAGVGVDSWKPADFPNPLPVDPATNAPSAFTPDPAEPVYVANRKIEPPPQPAVIPELKAQAEDLNWEGTTLVVPRAPCSTREHNFAFRRRIHETASSGGRSSAVTGELLAKSGREIRARERCREKSSGQRKAIAARESYRPAALELLAAKGMVRTMPLPSST
jgi:hypothetical protein